MAPGITRGPFHALEQLNTICNLISSMDFSKHLFLTHSSPSFLGVPSLFLYILTQNLNWLNQVSPT